MGHQPPSVYWRRRLVVLAALVLLIVLLVLTFNALFGGGGNDAAGTTNPPPPQTSGPVSSPKPSTAATTSAGSSSPSVASTATSSSTPPSSASSSVMPPACDTNKLTITAVPKQPSFAVGSEPELMMRVLNPGPGPCVQDVSDSKIELRVYNGASRVWGSHDCVVAPGTDLRTLLPNQPATFSMSWTGLSSQPGCAGTRQRVGAGTYTLYATLDGKDGTAATFELK